MIYRMASSLSKIFEEWINKFDWTEREITGIEVSLYFVSEIHCLQIEESKEDDQENGISEYEQKRLENIARNAEMMKSLGLDLPGLQAVMK